MAARLFFLHQCLLRRPAWAAIPAQRTWISGRTAPMRRSSMAVSWVDSGWRGGVVFMKIFFEDAAAS
jgi:hypothetical protein